MQRKTWSEPTKMPFCSLLGFGIEIVQALKSLCEWLFSSWPRGLVPDHVAHSLHLLCSSLYTLRQPGFFFLSWSAEHILYWFSFAFTYVVLLSSQDVLPSLPFFLPNISVLCECSLILTLAMSSLSSLIRFWLHVLSAVFSVHFRPCLCLLKQETSWCRIKSTGHWLESLLTVWAKL